mgnify:CR=1 FL=1
MKSLGQIAFEAYAEAKGGTTYDGKSIPGWDAVSEEVRQAWEVAALAVVAIPASSGLRLTEREVLEIKHAIFYANECKHGTTGHNQLLLIAKFAQHMGFLIRVNQYDTPESMSEPWTSVEIPAYTEVVA